MGYYVTLTDADFRIPKHNWDAAFEAVSELNKHDELKTGGSWSGGEQKEVWFAWMSADYPTDAIAATESGDVSHPLVFVLKQLGFEVAVLDEYLYLEMYDSKTGSEDLFLEALALYVTAGSYIEWRGEDGEMWRQDFDGKTMRTKTGRVVFQ